MSCMEHQRSATMSYLHTIMKILTTCRGMPKDKAYIKHKCKLNNAQLKKYLFELIEAGLLSKSRTNHYQTTVQGENRLATIRVIIQLNQEPKL